MQNYTRILYCSETLHNVNIYAGFLKILALKIQKVPYCTNVTTVFGGISCIHIWVWWKSGSYADFKSAV